MTKWREIGVQCLRDEAAAVLGLIPHIDDNFDRAVEMVIRCPGKLIVTGVGKSGHVGAKIAATMSSTGTPSFFVNPLDVFHGDLGVITSEDVVLAISNSGETDELLRFVPLLREMRVPVISMTGNASSKLAQCSATHLCIAVQHEACPLGLAPTSSTTAALAMGDALACALMEARNFKAADFAHFHPGGSLGKRLLTTAKDVMQTDSLPVVSPSMLMGEALLHMTSGRLGLCVAEQEGKVVGIVTDGDVRRAVQQAGDSFFQRSVEEVMTRNPRCVSPDAKITEIEHILHTNKIHSVLVTDSANHLLGIVDSFRTAL